jgi:tetratricopeptide (TPR) repeat protein
MRAHPGQPLGSAQTPEQLAERWNHSLTSMRGIAVIESQDWNGQAAKMDVDTSNLHPPTGWNVFTSGYAQAQSGDLAAAKGSLTRLRDIQTRDSASSAPDEQDEAYLDILTDELSGLISSKAGDMASGIAEVQRAAAIYDGMAFDFGPPATVKPPHELLGEVLLKENKAPQARAAFEASLTRAPKRVESLLGLARAERAMGDNAASAATYRELLQIWKNADPANAEVAEARRYAWSEIAKKQ